MGVIYLSHVSFSTITFLFLSLFYLPACGGAFWSWVLASKLYLLFRVLKSIQSEISSVVIWKMFSKIAKCNACIDLKLLVILLEIKPAKGQS